MNKEDTKKIKDMLLSEYSIINQNNKDSLLTDRDDKGDEVDLANSISTNEFSNRIYARNTLYLEKIRNTLSKIENNTYGICMNCEEEIELKRLMVRPTAEYCIGCKEAQEVADGRSKSGLASKSLKKMGVKV